MRTRSLCVLTAALVLSTAITACGGSSSGAQAQQETTETISASTQAAATDTTVIEAATEAISKPAPLPLPEPEPEPEPPRSPLTGKIMDEELLKQRPLAVMYPINQQAQPQYGLDRVDVFYEIMEEGNMSRQTGRVLTGSEISEVSAPILSSRHWNGIPSSFTSADL